MTQSYCRVVCIVFGEKLAAIKTRLVPKVTYRAACHVCGVNWYGQLYTRRMSFLVLPTLRQTNT